MTTIIVISVAGAMAAHDYALGLVGWSIVDLMIVACVVGAYYSDKNGGK